MKRWKFTIAATLVVVSGTAMEGYHRWPTRAAEGTSLVGTASHPPRKGAVRLGTYNIDGGMGLDGKRDLSRAATVIKDCDLVGLNEIHGAPLLGSQNQAELLGEADGLSWLFAPVERQWWRDAFGNAVLTTLPVNRWQRLPLAADSASSNRNVLLLSVVIGQQPVNVLISHVERGHDHESQLRAVIGLYQSLAAPAILLGDLNAIDDEPQIRQLIGSPGVVDAIGHTIANVPKHVDWIFLRGLHPTAGGMQPRGVSDHPFFWVDVEKNDPE